MYCVNTDIPMRFHACVCTKIKKIVNLICIVVKLTCIFVILISNIVILFGKMLKFTWKPVFEYFTLN